MIEILCNPSEFVRQAKKRQTWYRLCGVEAVKTLYEIGQAPVPVDRSKDTYGRARSPCNRPGIGALIASDLVMMDTIRDHYAITAKGAIWLVSLHEAGLIHLPKKEVVECA